MSTTPNNVYVHSSPPKAISGSGAAIRQWVKNGDVEKLESLVLEGQGARLLGLVESSTDPRVKAFLKSIPAYMAKVDLIHDAVIRGSLRETQALIDKKKLATARDAVGRGVGHKAVLYNNKSILEWLAKKHPEILNLKDNEGRTSLHYAAASRDSEEMYDLLVNLGGNPEIIDMHGRKPNYYINHPEELDIEGPNVTTQRSLSRGKRRKISPITPPKRKLIVSPPSITRAQIRIWIHEKDIPKLEKIVWSGHGDKLLLETTNNGKVRRFLENIPHLLSRIKSIHGAAINNDLEGLKGMRTKTELHEIFKAKDLHGLTPLHKAAGLGNRGIMEYLIYEIPDAMNEVDNEGRTPAHYAARDPNSYSFLIKNGADENVLDQKGKSPSYYRSHPHELDTRHLRNVPDAPRVSGELSGWDRASPIVNAGKRRSDSGDFTTNNNSNITGKYDLNNVELSEGDLRVEEIDFAPDPPVLTKSISRLQSREDVLMGNGESKSRTSSKAELRSESSTGSEKEFMNEAAAVAAATAAGFAVVTTQAIADTADTQPIVETSRPLTRTESKSKVERKDSKQGLQKRRESISRRDSKSEIPRRNSKIEIEESGKSLQRKETFVQETTSPPPPSDNQNTNGPVAMEEDISDSPVEITPQPEQDEAMEMDTTVELEREPSPDPKQKERRMSMREPVEPPIPERKPENISAKQKELPVEQPLAEEFRPKSMRGVVQSNPSEVKEPMKIEEEANAKEMKNRVEEVKQTVAKTIEKVPGVTKSVNRKAEEIVDEVVDTAQAEVDELVEELEAKQKKQEIIDEVEEALKRGDMESLVDKILDGKGEELVNRSSDNKEVQEFLVNVPAYIVKIASIHQAASNGNLRDLQGLLDRKRLALARNKQGRGPLHLAVLNNHTTVARYLASTYPQTLQLLDSKGRSALHYAATLSDSGAMYKFLVNLGADPNIKDVEDNTPGIYLRNGDLLTQKQLLDEDIQIEIDNPPVQRWERPKTPPDNLDDGQNRFPAIWSEEGKYLASVLGDALVKGLTEVSQERPEDPVEYLANFLRKYHGDREEPLEKAGGGDDDREIISPLNPPPPLDESYGLNESDGSTDGDELIRRLDDEVDAIETVDREEEEEEERHLREQQQMRDEKGQSVLHFAGSRSGGAQTIFSFLQNPAVNLAWRDEKLKTARDIASESGRIENVLGIDSYVVSLALQGQLESLQKLLLDGYDHLTDITDSARVNILQIPSIPDNILSFLKSVDDFQERIRQLHRAIRLGNFEHVKEFIRNDPKLASGMSPYGRCALHIAVLAEEHSIAQLLANEFPETLKRGDHLERMPLHYAMGVEKVEKMTRILVRAGAKRVVKDLRGRQPSYYFINREEIAILQDEEQQLKQEYS